MLKIVTSERLLLMFKYGSDDNEKIDNPYTIFGIIFYTYL